MSGRTSPPEAQIEEIPNLEQVELQDDSAPPQLDYAMLQETLARLQQPEGGDAPPVFSSKMRKQYNKTMQRFGFKQVPHVGFVKLSGGDGGATLRVENPEVYRFPGTNSFLIFGKPQMDSSQGLMELIKKQQQQKEEGGGDVIGEALKERTEVTEEDVVVGEADEDEVDVVMAQTNASREEAIKALAENNNDVVNAIMSLGV